MAITFTGTNTGKTYVAGTKVSNGNGTYTVQADGTFKNDKTGRSAVGSSRSESTVWGTTSTGALGAGSAGRAAANAHENGLGSSRRPSGGSGGSGAGRAGVVTAKPVTAGPGVPAAVKPGSGSGAFLGGGFLSGQPAAGGGIVPAWTIGVHLPAANVKATQIFIDGVAVPRDPGTSDVGDINQVFGEGDDPWSPGFIPSWGTAIEHYDYVLSQTWAAQQILGFREGNKERWDRAVRGEGFADPTEDERYSRPGDPYGFSNPRFGQ